MTGKGVSWGGSLIRPEATGYGVVYFTENMLNHHNESIKDKTVVISGSGNVAQFAAEKCIQLGAKVLTLSDSSGYLYDAEGLNEEKLAHIMHLKNVERKRLHIYFEKYPKAAFFPNKKVWEVAGDIALPCATQNELDISDAKKLVANGCQAVGEGANMPCTPEAIAHFQSNNVLYAPGKASNAGELLFQD